MDYAIESKPCSSNAWFTPAQSNAYYKARYSREGITLHWWGDGTGADNHDAIVNYFLGQAQAAVKSVNYVVSDKKITCMVDPDNVAWCSQGGNPTTISIECQPTLSDEGYKRLGWLIAYLEKRYGHRMSLYGHNHWFATSCPGTISQDRARKEADGVNTGGINVTPSPTPKPTNPQVTAPAASNGAKSVTLPASVKSWRLYNENGPYTPGSEKATLAPSQFGGLTYNIVRWIGTNAVVIDTQMFGRGAIWVKDTEAQFGGITSSGSANTPAPAATGSRTLVLPGSVDSWRVYKLGGPWTVGSEIAKLRPALFGGLSYPILGSPAANIYIIKTQDFGQVAIYAGPDTEAQFK